MYIKKFFPMAPIALFMALASGAIWAQSFTVEDAWTRATVPGQKATGVFMALTATEDAALLGGDSPAAGVTEVHAMSMDGDVMKMRALKELALPANETVELTPGGFHIMLMDLKEPLAQDSTIHLTLQLRNAQGQTSELPVDVSVRAVSAGAGAHDTHHDDHDHHDEHK